MGGIYWHHGLSATENRLTYMKIIVVPYLIGRPLRILPIWLRGRLLLPLGMVWMIRL